MISERKIVKNTVLLTTGKVLGDACTFLFLVIFARMFGVDLLGKYAFAMAAGGMLTVFISLGLNTLLVRDISQDRTLRNKYVANLLITQGVLALLAWILIGMVAALLPVSGESKIIIVIIGTYHVFYKLTMLMRSQFRAFEEMKYSAYLELYHKIAILLLGLPALMIWKDAVVTLVAYPVSAFSMFILGYWISIARYGWPTAKVELAFVAGLVKQAMPFFAVLLLGELYVRMGVFVLTLIQGEAAAGVYAAGDRLLTTMAAGVHTFGAALLPAMSRLWISDRAALLKLFERAIRLMLVAVLPVSTLLFIAGEPIILILFGQEYAESIGVFKIRCWSLLFMGLNVILSGFLFVHHRQRDWVKLQMISFVAFGVACLLSIPAFSYLGLASARISTEVLLFAMVCVLVGKTIHPISLVRMGTAPVLSCALAILSYFILARSGYWISVPVSILVCGAAMFLFKGIRYQDIVFAREMLLKTEDSAGDEESGVSTIEETAR